MEHKASVDKNTKYGGFFTVRKHSSEFDFKSTWNKYRLLESGNELILMENNGKIHTMENTYYDFTNRYFVILRDDGWYLYHDEPWDLEKYIMKFEIDEELDSSHALNVFLIESTIGLLFIIHRTNGYSMFKLNVEEKTIKEITNLQCNSKYKRYYGSGGIFMNRFFCNYESGNMSTIDLLTSFNNYDFILHMTEIPGIDVLNISNEFVSRVIVFDESENKVLHEKDYSTEVGGDNVVRFVFDRFIVLSPTENDYMITDIHTDQIYYSNEQEIVGMTRKDDGTGYFIWIEETEDMEDEAE